MGNICRAPKPSAVSDQPTFQDYYNVVKRLDGGGFGDVYICTDRNNGNEYAAKFVDNYRVPEWSKCDVEDVPMEVKAMTLCDHPNIISLVDYFIYSQHSVFVMEKPAHSVDLFNYTVYLGGLSERESRRTTQQILEAIWHLHYAARIVHRDIKPENILIDVVDGLVKIIDFGSSTWIKSDHYTEYHGTRIYAPPEVYTEGHYKAEPLTVWSIGCTLYFMLFCKHAFGSIEDIIEYNISIPNDIMISEDCLIFLNVTLHRYANRRLNVDAIMKHKWLNHLGFYFR